jgi:hypothetical protein
MPVRTIDNSDVGYYLVVFDENGHERREPDGTLMSETVRRRIADPSAAVTDVFFTSHGWKGDVPSAIEQYDKWVGTMARLQSDRDAARQRRSDFAPLIVGLHWPSLPWGDETIPANGDALLSGGDEIEAQVDAYASRIVDTRKARLAIRSIIEAAHRDPDSTSMSPEILDAYAILFAESGLGSGDASGRPGADQDGFDPVAIIADASAGAGQAAASGAPGLLGVGDKLRDALLMPLRQLSFWKMKDRARQFGETGGHELLIRLQLAAPNARFHLMGHSFGCIVVSSTVAGTPSGPPLPRPVDSLFLVQGALSLWSYAEDIPYAPGTAGYFHRILEHGFVRGPIVTTRSTYDTAVGRFYPLGAQLKKQLVLGEEHPAYGGIGSFGIRGVVDVEDMPMQAVTFTYDFRPGRVYNLEASGVIRNGGGASGAHSDISHPEVAHAFWSAVIAGQLMSSSSPAPGGAPSVSGGLLSADSSDLHPSATPQRGPGSIMKGGGGGGGVGPRFGRRVKAEAPPPASPDPIVQRWVNAEIDDHAPDAPLVTQRWYTLAFDVDVAQRESAVAVEPLLSEEKLFPAGTEEVMLTVQLDSADFEISEPTRPLRLPRVGKSHTKARFEILPQHDGPSALKATIHKDGNFIQQMELTFDVGATHATPVLVSARGRPPSAAAVVHPRDVGLSISPGPGGYDCVVWGAVSARARLPLQPEFLASAIDTARREIMKVVMQQDAGGNYIFQTGIEIPAADRDVALRTMARAGATLFQKMFFGPAAGADSKAIGEFLRKMASDSTTQLKLQIVAETTPVPWGLLYVGNASAGAKLDWDNFIGMRHVIEQIPLQNTLNVVDCMIPSDKPQLAVSVNVNNEIDRQMGADFVAQQQVFWKAASAARKRVHVTGRSTGKEVIQALANGTTDDQILYFYCHAGSVGLADPGGPDSSNIVLTDGSITLSDLNLDAPTTVQLRGNPLVFINACESAEMSPAFYDGFVPYFMAKGARGVIGTECKTPALFAVAWAKRFFERFLDGEPLGEVFLGLRREFLDKHGNPLGLLYAVHCDGDTQVEPGLPVLSI